MRRLRVKKFEGEERLRKKLTGPSLLFGGAVVAGISLAAPEQEEIEGKRRVRSEKGKRELRMKMETDEE